MFRERAPEERPEAEADGEIGDREVDERRVELEFLDKVVREEGQRLGYEGAARRLKD